MEYAQVKEFLDMCVRDYCLATRDHSLTNHIRLSVAIESEILVNEGMEIIADIMGLEIREEKMPEESVFKYGYTFVYDGIKFVTYEKERMARFTGTQSK